MPADNSILKDLRSQLRETLDTLRTVRAERDALLEFRSQVAALEKDLESADQVELGLKEQIYQLEERIEKLEAGLPVRELAEAKGRLTTFGEREVALEEEVRQLEATKVELENDWATEKIDWMNDRKKLVDKIKTSGNEGARRIQDLKGQIEVLEDAKLQ